MGIDYPLSPIAVSSNFMHSNKGSSPSSNKNLLLKATSFL